MSDAKHTPGPWRCRESVGAGIQLMGVIPFQANCAEFTLGKDTEQPIFVLVGYEPWMQFPPKEWNEMQAANALLIEAAPKLLEACQHALRDWGVEARNKMRDAIGRATATPKETD